MMVKVASAQFCRAEAAPYISKGNNQKRGMQNGYFTN